MKTRNLIISALSFVALVLAVAPIEHAYAQKPSGTRDATWEYTSTGYQEGSDTPTMNRNMNKLGNDGWELVALDTRTGRYWFKRPKP